MITQHLLHVLILIVNPFVCQNKQSFILNNLKINEMFYAFENQIQNKEYLRKKKTFHKPILRINLNKLSWFYASK